MRKLPALAVTVLLVLLLVVAVGAAIATGGPSTASTADSSSAPAQSSAPASAAPQQPAAPEQPSAPAQPGNPVSVAFFGDGYTSGSPAGGRGPANYTSLLSASEGWMVTTNGVYGSGYVADPALETRLQAIVQAAPQVVVVNAGRADNQENPQAVGAAATQLYQDLKTRLPQARIVVIGPMWLGSEAPPPMLAVRDAIREAATGAQLPFVDPIEARWFIGSDQDGIAPGNEILNDRGHQRLAQLVDEAVARTGAIPQ